MTQETTPESLLGVVKVTAGPLRDAAEAAGCLFKIGRSYYIDPTDIGEIKAQCRVQAKAPASTDEKTRASGSSETTEKTSAPALAALKSLKKPLPTTSRKKTAATVTPIRGG